MVREIGIWIVCSSNWAATCLLNSDTPNLTSSIESAWSYLKERLIGRGGRVPPNAVWHSIETVVLSIRKMKLASHRRELGETKFFAI